jgi:hypothetical protein
LGGQAGIVGQHLTLEDSPCIVVGIMPPSFVFYPTQTNMWTLITPSSELDRNPDRNGVAVFGRLKPGVSRASAEADLRLLAHAIDQGRRYAMEMEPVSFDLQREFTWLAGRNLRRDQRGRLHGEGRREQSQRQRRDARRRAKAVPGLV